ncbi:hypothetical protein FRAHR75_810013 [Frankia sp. Hr75.2]|nr:hypothetical protein FRAHR75_810013 [Frankia sp. Hr75.2]
MPLHFHIGGGEGSSSRKAQINADRIAVHGIAGFVTYLAVDLFFKNGIQCTDLISSGVLQRFPRLNFVSVESGIGWCRSCSRPPTTPTWGPSHPGANATPTICCPQTCSAFSPANDVWATARTVFLQWHDILPVR